MKKHLLPLIAVILFGGCATAPQKEIKPISMKSVSLLEKYGISENALVKAGNAYYFVIPAPNGSDIYKLDSQYRLVWKKTTPILLDPVKYEIRNSDLYILGYDQSKNRPVLLIYSLEGKLKKMEYFGEEFDLARDFCVIGGEVYTAVTKYTKNNNSDIVIYNTKKQKIVLSTPYMDDVKFIKPYKNGLLIVGTVQKESEDVIIAYKTLDNKTVWAKEIDLGMDEKPLSVKIENSNIILKLVSTDNMGAEKEAIFTINGKGEIQSVKKGIEFKQLPIKYRT